MEPTDNASKVCRDCGRLLSLDKFSRNGRKDGYRRPECRECQHKRSKEINPNYQMTAGAVAARKKHNLLPREVAAAKAKKLAAQGYECAFCSAKLQVSDSHLDHQTPLARGGTHDMENLQVLCRRCNSEKHAKTNAEYVEWLISIGANHAPDRRGKVPSR